MQGQASKILKETCNYIRKLEREVDELSERLSRLLDTIDSSSEELDRSLLNYVIIMILYIYISSF
ncbi:Transcription factor PRE5 [Linum perenne]